MLKKYLPFAFLLGIIAFVPALVTAQSAPPELKEYVFTTEGLAPVVMLKYSEKVDIVAVFKTVTKSRGEEEVSSTLLQDVWGLKAEADGINSKVTLLLSQAEIDLFDKFLKENPDAALIVTVRNEADVKVFPLGQSSFRKLFS